MCGLIDRGSTGSGRSSAAAGGSKGSSRGRLLAVALSAALVAMNSSNVSSVGQLGKAQGVRARELPF